MKKTILKISLTSVAAIALLAGSAVASPINDRDPAIIPAGPYGSEDSLQTIFDNVTGGVLDVSNQSTAGLWNHTDILATTAFEIVYFTAGGGNIGLYDTLGNMFDFTTFLNLNNNNPAGPLPSSDVNSLTFAIFDSGKLEVNGSEAGTGWSNSFGFYWDRGGNKVYTQDSLNNGVAQALSYQLMDGTPLDFSYYNGSNRGFAGGGDDWIIAFDNYGGGGNGDFNDAVIAVKDMSPVPEPTTMLLFGAGLAGLAGISRRKRS